MIIDEGALPLVVTLRIGHCPQLKDLPYGIHRLKCLKYLQFEVIPTEFVLSMQPNEGPDFGRSSMFLLFVFGVRFKGYATNATSSVILSRWNFFEGNSKDGEPKFSHHVWDFIGITLYAITLLYIYIYFFFLFWSTITLLYLQCYQWFLPEILLFYFILLLLYNE